MKKVAAIFFFLLNLSVSNSQNNADTGKKFTALETTIYYKLVNKIIPIKISQYGDRKDIVMINLHSDETTSVIAAYKFLETNGGLLIKIENSNARNIRFSLNKQPYTFDPNGMFSIKGINKSLKEHGNISDVAVAEIEKFAHRILQLIPEKPSCIIALHNNTKDHYSVTTYLRGNEKETDAKSVNVNPRQDADDFFLTTDSLLYQQLINEKYNCILQDNENANKDGSLSVYCGEKKLRYLNCETLHGKTELYLEMLIAAKKYIEKTKTISE